MRGTASVMGMISTSETGANGITIGSSHILAGVAAITKMGGTGSLTQTGKTCAFYVGMYDTTNWSDASPTPDKWGIGLYMPTAAVTQGIRIGDWKAAGALGNAIVFSATATDSTDTSQLDLLAVYGESTTALGAGINAKCGRFRHLVAGSSLQTNHETYGVVGQLVGRSTTLLHLHAGVLGTFEANTTAVVCNGAYAFATAAVMARVGGLALITATKPVCGFSAFLNGSAALGSGTSVAYAADCLAPTTASWDYLLAANGAANFFYAATGTAYENSVKIGAVTMPVDTNHTDASGLIRIKVNTTLYYIPIYAAGDLTGE
jgi:hypothetical protein